jgi:hypothetical protein
MLGERLYRCEENKVSGPTGKHVVVFLGLVLLAVLTRLEMWLPNFHAVTAATLFAGFYFRGRLAAACVPVVAMALSNWVLGGYAWEVMLAVYSAMLLPLAARGWLRSNLSAPRVVVCSVASTLAFYLLTNAAVWHVGVWYPRSFAGLIDCYVAAVPFLFNALVGDLAFSALLFGAYALATSGRSRFASAPTLRLTRSVG